MDAQISGLLDRWADAERRGDVAQLDALLADDFVGIGPVGFVLDRDRWLGRFEHGLTYRRLDLDEVDVHPHGSTVIAVAHQHAEGRAGAGTTPADLRLSVTIVGDDVGEPRIAGMQYSFIGRPALTAPATARSTYRPSGRQRAANATLAWLLRRGLGPPFIRLLTVEGRTTGRRYTTPVVPVEQDGSVWLVSPFGEVSWVRNLRATRHADLDRGSNHASYHAREVDAAEAVPVLRAYLSMPGERFVRRDFYVTARSTDDELAAEAPRHPVFALTPRS